MQSALDEKLFAALMGDMTPKFLATRDAAGVPNVVPIISIRPHGRTKLIFGNFLMWKTERNLEANPQVSVTVFTANLFGATIRGVFEGFQKVGEYVDEINSSPMLRYNAYMGVRSAGSIDVLDISPSFRVTKAQMLGWNLRSKVHKAWGRRYTRGKSMLHPVMAGKFSRIAAVKVIAFIDNEGYPYAVPVVALNPVAKDVLVFSKPPMDEYLRDLRSGASLAACVITTEPVAFQVKGTYMSIDEKWGAILVDSSFHASPPFVGKQIA